MKELALYIKVGLYWLLIFLVGFVSLLRAPEFDYQIIENNSKSFSIIRFNEYISQLDKYLELNLAWRQIFVVLQTKIDALLTGGYGSNMVLEGKDDWLFYVSESAGETGSTIKNYQGLTPFTNFELKRISENILYLKNEVEKSGSQLVILIAPDKSTIYEEYLPSYVKRFSMTTRFDQLLEYLPNEIKLLDVRQKLLKNKVYAPVYYRTDTHWNSFGSFIVANEIGSNDPSNAGYLLKLEDFNIWKGQILGSGDIVVSTPPLRKYIDIEIVMKPKLAEYYPRHDLPIDDHLRLYDYSWGKIDSDNRLMVFGDSYAEKIIDFLTVVYPSGIYRKSTLDLSLVRQYKPKMVLWEIAERNIHLLEL